MKQFIQRFSDKITGVLSGFDRLILRGTLRPISYAYGMKGFLWLNQIMLKDFGRYVDSVSKQLKQASCQAAHDQQRPVIHLHSSRTNKEARAQQVVSKDGITSGLIAVISCVESCMSYKLQRVAKSKELDIELRPRRCLYLYHYLIDPQFGWMNARIQTWFPFNIQICLNGREWLSRQMDKAGIKYRRLDNCFPWIQDFAKAQKLMDQQLRTAWPTVLDRFVRMLNPIHGKIFKAFPLRYYWSSYQNEWATDIAFKSPSALASIYRPLVWHGMVNFSSRDVMRFWGRKVRTAEVVTDFKERPEGVRIKHRVGKNWIKLYDKFAIVLRSEFTMNDPEDFKVFRPKENDPGGECKWRSLRRGVADIHRRAQVSQAAIDRYLDALAAADTSIPLGDLLEEICKPTTWKGKRIRALRPWSEEDLELFTAINRGEFSVNGFRNCDLQALLFKGTPNSTKEKRRRSGRVTRLMRMLRAHHLLQKVNTTYRYVLTPKGRQIIGAALTARRVTLEQLNRAAA